MTTTEPPRWHYRFAYLAAMGDLHMLLFDELEGSEQSSQAETK